MTTLPQPIPRKSLCLHREQCAQMIDWKSNPIFQKFPQKNNHGNFYLKNYVFKLPPKSHQSFVLLLKDNLSPPKSHQSFVLLLKDNLSPRTLKNRPIWSHSKALTSAMNLWAKKLKKNQTQQNRSKLGMLKTIKFISSELTLRLKLNKRLIGQE